MDEDWGDEVCALGLVLLHSLTEELEVEDLGHGDDLLSMPGRVEGRRQPGVNVVEWKGRNELLVGGECKGFDGLELVEVGDDVGVGEAVVPDE